MAIVPCANRRLLPPKLFILALAPAEVRRRISVAYVSVTNNRPTIEVTQLDLDEQRQVPLISLPTLDSVNLCTNREGSHVAICQGQNVHLFDGAASQTSVKFAEPIEQFTFANVDTLVIRCGSQLFSLRPGARTASSIKSGVRRVVAGRPLVTISLSGGVDIADIDNSNFSWKTIQTISIPNNARLYCKLQADILYIATEGKGNGFKTRFLLYSKELRSGRSTLLFSEDIYSNTGRGSAAQFFPWQDGAAVIAAERSGYTRLWLVDGTNEPRALSPENIEVFNSSPNAELSNIALVGSNIREPTTSGFRRLILVSTDANKWHSSTIARGSFLLPKWFNRNWLTYAEDIRGEHRWTLVARECFGLSLGTKTVKRSSLTRTREHRSSKLIFTTIRPSRVPPSQAAILYVQGPYRQITCGAQDSFFHQWLFTTVLEAATPPITFVGMNGPGSLGLGARVRQPMKLIQPLLDCAGTAIAALIHDLRKEGIQRIGIMCGSLGALPVLRSLTSVDVEACCFVSAVLDPVFVSSSSVTPIVRKHACVKPSLEKIKAGVSLMFIHGERDEFTPPSECVQLIQTIPDGISSELILMPDEGHIFRSPFSWKQVADRSRQFLRNSLLGDSYAQ